MKVDVYTKLVLTVIAICLTPIVLREIGIIPTANVVKVQIVGIDESSGLRWEAIPVKIEE